jgi:signal transduction histidine kinase/CheY-like chemotaxis protein
MIVAWLMRLIEPSEHVTDPDGQRRARVLAALMLIATPTAIFAGTYDQVTRGNVGNFVIVNVGAYLLLAGTYVASRTRHYMKAAAVVSLMAVVVPLFGALARPDGLEAVQVLNYMLLGVVFAVFYFSPRVIAFYVVLMALCAGTAIQLHPALSFAVTGNVLPPLLLGGALAVVGGEYIRRTIAARKLAEEKLIVADRLASMGTLAASIGHELNNPLSYVLANLEFLEEHITDEEQREVLDDVLEGTHRMVGVVHDLRLFARTDTEPRPVDLNATLQSALAVAAGQLKGVAIVQSMADARAVIATDARLGQVLLNLAVNAGQAMEGSEVRRLSFTSEPAGDMVRVIIEDTGGGVPDEVRERVFEPFFTTKPMGKGTGLGLAISRQLIEGWGGRLWLDPASTHGARFVMELPATDEAPGGWSFGPVSDHGERRRLLIIDDDARVGRALGRSLTAFEVTWVGSGEGALETLADQSYDAVLCDVVMPGMDGLTLYAKLRERKPKMADRLLFLTGGMPSGSLGQMIEATGRPVLYKPLSASAIDEALQAMATGKQTRVSLPQ